MSQGLLLRVKKFAQKYNFAIVCFFCLAFAISAIWLKYYSLIVYLSFLVACSLFYDINQIIVLCSFALFFEQCFDFWSTSAVVAIVTTVICLKQILHKKKKLSKDLILPILIFLSFVVMFFTVNFDKNNIKSIFSFISVVGIAIEFYFLRTDFKVDKVIKYLTYIFLFSCILALSFNLIGVNVNVYHIDSANIHRFMSLTGHEGITAMISMILIAFYIMLFFKKNVSFVEFILVEVMLSFIGLLTKSKMFLLVFVCLLAIYLILVYLKNWKNGLIQTALIVFFVAITFLCFPEKVTQYLSRFTEYFVDGDILNKITTGRLYIWKDYVSAWLSGALTIIFGIGGTFNPSSYSHSHNDYLECLTRYGVFGFCLMLTFVVYFVIKTRKNFVKEFVNWVPLGTMLTIMFFDPFSNARTIFLLLAVLSICDFKNQAQDKSEERKIEEGELLLKVNQVFKISVIVPVYNVEKYLSKCIDSILNQTYKNIELILIDDGSVDGSFKICNDYAQSNDFIKVIHKKNEGVSSARNDGLKVATGDMVMFVDADDFLQVNMLEKMVQSYLENKSDIVITGFNIVKNNVIKHCVEKSIEEFCVTKNIELILNRSRIIENENEYQISKNVPCFLWRMMFTSQIVKEKKFDPNVKVMEDTLFLLDMLGEADLKLSYVDDYLYNYMVRENSAMHKKGKILDSHINFYKHLEKSLKDEKYSEYLKLYQFTLYCDCVSRTEIFGAGEDYSGISSWKSKENYIVSKKYTYGFALKLKNFLIYHNKFKLLKLLYKIHG